MTTTVLMDARGTYSSRMPLDSLERARMRLLECEEAEAMGYSCAEEIVAIEHRIAHTCPTCGTPAPAIYATELRPSWECSVCLAAAV